MKIRYDERFIDDITDIILYIAHNNPRNSTKFKNDLKSAIEKLSENPYKCRQSIYFENEQIRDLVYKGYVTAYKIDEQNNEIIVLGIIKYKEKW
jgi:plasmid stabilization system protein ParE